jgi:chorismate dehydratase
MARVRLAYVRYLNTAPLVQGLEACADLELIPAAPSHIAGLIAGGEADLGLASVVDAATGPLSIVPVGMIGCDGPTMTVRLFSAVPPASIRVLHADTDSHTSVVLARVLLAKLHGVQPRIVDFDARERTPLEGPGAEGPLDRAWPESVLLIGDKVVTDAPPADRYPHQVDLGEAWRAWTGLPFVYAAWMCRRGEESSDAVALAAAGGMIATWLIPNRWSDCCTAAAKASSVCAWFRRERSFCRYVGRV